MPTLHRLAIEFPIVPKQATLMQLLLSPAPNVTQSSRRVSPIFSVSVDKSTPSNVELLLVFSMELANIPVVWR